VRRGDAVHPGDSIEFEVRAGAAGFVAVVSRDPRGEVTVYYPFGGHAAAPYDPRSPILPGAIALDDVLGRETVWAIWRDKPFDLALIVQAVHAGRAPDGEGKVASTEWRKE
jgi:hypothetical protein